MKSVPRLGSCILAVLLGGCPGAPRQVVYDLAARTSAAERWSSREVVLFGTPAAEPYLADGFHREAPGASGDAFVWSKAESEVAFRIERIVPRLAVLDLAPFRGVRAQAVEVLLNDVFVGRFALNDTRHRYRLDLPAEAQRAGDNRLRFRFAATAAPAAADPKSTDKRELAAAFYAMVLGEEGDVGLEDLLTPDAPRPFEAGEGTKGAPALTLVGPSIVRFAIRVPAGGELRFTPALHPGALAAAAGATFRVLCQEATGGERELWSRVLQARDAKVEEQTVRLPGGAGDILRLGLAVGPATTTFRPLRLGGLHGTSSVGPWCRREPASGTAVARRRSTGRPPAEVPRRLERGAGHPRRRPRPVVFGLWLTPRDDPADRCPRP